MAREGPSEAHPPKFGGRTLEQIASRFRSQYGSDDCLVAALEGILREFGERRGFDLAFPRDDLKGLCGYRNGFGSHFSKMVPNLNTRLRNLRLGRLVEAKETLGGATTLALISGICESEETSFPIIGVGSRYWEVQTHLRVTKEHSMDHALVVLKATPEEVVYYDPFQRPGPAASTSERVYSMPYVTLSQLSNEALMAVNWLFWLTQTGFSPVLESFQPGRVDG